MVKKIPSSQHIGNICDRDAQRIISPCRLALAKALRSENIAFSENPLTRPVSEYALRGENATSAYVGKRQYSVLPLEEIGQEIYWLGVILQLTFNRGNYYLSNISILIVKGLAEDSNKTAVLRAEWNCLEEYLLHKHAQPHWHIYPSSVIRNWEAEELLTNPDKDFGEQPEKELLPKFHFAMASSWQLGNKTPHAELADISAATKWLSSCINYIRGELLYIWGF